MKGNIQENFENCLSYEKMKMLRLLEAVSEQKYIVLEKAAFAEFYTWTLAYLKPNYDEGGPDFPYYQRE